MFRKDLTGKKFGRLTVLSFAYMKNNHSYWNCQCECGTIKTYLGKRLTKIKSCGCLLKETASQQMKKKWETGIFSREKLASFKDGRTKWFLEHPNEKRLYQTWIGIRRRAGGNRYKNNSDDRHAKIYSHLTVAPEWNDWLSFYNWAKNNGWKPGLTIDRIDNSKGYYPDNCRWVSRAENNRNRRCVVYYDWHGEKLTLGQIAEKEGFNIRDIERARNRIKNYGYSVYDAFYKINANQFFIP